LAEEEVVQYLDFLIARLVVSTAEPGFALGDKDELHAEGVGEGLLAGGVLDRRAVRIHPSGADDVTMMPVARRILEGISITFIEVIEGERVAVGLKARRRLEILVITSRLGNPRFSHDTVEPRSAGHPAKEESWKFLAVLLPNVLAGELAVDEAA